MLPFFQRKRSNLQPVRKIKLRRMYVRLVLLFVPLTIGIAVIFTVSRPRSRPLVIKLHNSEQRFVEETLHEIVLVPKKLAPTRSPALRLKELCAKLKQGKCGACSKAGGGGRQPEALKAQRDPEGAELSPKDVWPARRRGWREDRQLLNLRYLLASDTGYWRAVDLMHTIRIQSGMYVVMLQDWLRVFPRDHVHVLHYETFQRRMRIELIKLVKFLGLRGVTLSQIDSMMQRAGGHEKKRKKKETHDREGEEGAGEDEELLRVLQEEEEEEEGGMLKETREMLNGFYLPYNKLLATVLEDDSFLWQR